VLPAPSSGHHPLICQVLEEHANVPQDHVARGIEFCRQVVDDPRHCRRAVATLDDFESDRIGDEQPLGRKDDPLVALFVETQPVPKSRR